mmetsp:Transcript_27075/g.45118  ORF Transcript_27075/g.45118 Transcript_27075/m.45118 type:complete len:237 (+) Transcript_27075:101-811(+)|eukprot:CAMPEP_0119005208 /NCGR_PEP_ID=MMETSP1176-20130426/1585_1 /TAXON_ID=265551 /ORGANISM="Synedropsis recta cf, Strain CCMP1620" /LENGTH=236 /DNA_ID=CAMNT_0006956985 /DNA_START=51 /DNA_END=761 /DNA_ORIENTATION=+
MSKNNSIDDEEDYETWRAFMESADFLNESLTTLIRRPIFHACCYSTGGILGAYFLGSSIFVRTLLYADAIFVLGPLGAARGLISATRTVMIDSGIASNVGRGIYNAALEVVEQDQEDGDKAASSGNLREAIQTLRETYPLADAFILGEGFIGSVSRYVANWFLPNVGDVFHQIDDAVALAEKHGEALQDAEVVALATRGVLDSYLHQKENFVLNLGLFLYSTVAGVTYTLNYGFGA